MLQSENIKDFAQEVIRFQKWATDPQPNSAFAAEQAIVRITCLYLAALNLPALPTDNVDAELDCPQLDSSENCKVIAHKFLPLDLYSQVFNPLVIPPEEPVIGSLADDIMDIYRDVVTGLRAYQNGDVAAAHWQWSFQFKHHWGKHATGAIRALHAWLAARD